MVPPDDPSMLPVPEFLRPFVLKCMSYRPAERFQDTRACAVEVARLADAVQTGAQQPKVGAAWLRRFDRATHPTLVQRVRAWFGRK
jgi:hypothetical protein